MTEPITCAYAKQHEELFIFVPPETNPRCQCKCSTCCYEANRCLEPLTENTNGETTTS